MSLKKFLNVYEFETELPGSGETVKYKGLTTNTMKKLIIYQNETDPLKEEEILDSVIKLSLVDSVSIDDMYILDRYYLFIKIREATKGRLFQFHHNCKQCKSQSLQSMDINKLIVNKPKKFNKNLNILNNQIVFEMSYPIRKTQKNVFKIIDKTLSDSQKKIELSLADIASYIIKITTPDGDQKIDYKELIDFIGDLPEKELDNINKWKKINDFGIKLEHKIKCKSCGHVEVVPLPLTNFFS